MRRIAWGARIASALLAISLVGGCDDASPTGDATENSDTMGPPGVACSTVLLCSTRIELQLPAPLSEPGYYQIDLHDLGSCEIALMAQAGATGAAGAAGEAPMLDPAVGGTAGAPVTTAGAAGAAATPARTAAGLVSVVDCSGTDFTLDPPDGIGVSSLLLNRAPARMQVTISKDGEVLLDRSVTPDYEVVTLGRPGCEETCHTATVPL